MRRELDVATLRLNVVHVCLSVSMIVTSIDIRFLTAIRHFPEIKVLLVGATNGRHTALDPSSARGGTEGERPLCSNHTATPYPPSSRRSRPIHHAESAASLLIAAFPAAFKIIDKTMSTQAAACTVPQAICPDRASRS